MGRYRHGSTTVDSCGVHVEFELKAVTTGSPAFTINYEAWLGIFWYVCAIFSVGLRWECGGASVSYSHAMPTIIFQLISETLKL